MDLSHICHAAIQRKASDIHLKADRPPLFRINGELRPLQSKPISADALARLAWDMMSAQQRDKFKETSDLDMGVEYPGIGRFRANVFRQRQKVGMVLRVIPDRVMTIDQMGLPHLLKKIASVPRGLILVTGATGSGKSTTLAAMIQHINEAHHRHILTIEDPIEFVYQDEKGTVTQREVGVDSMSFRAALHAALRQDPDVVMVGELRDRETIEIAMQAAEAGRLVMGTLHTVNAPETITRLVNVFPLDHQQHIRLLLASTLHAVVSQRLVPDTMGGRLAALEIMLNTGAVKEFIIDAARTREIPEVLESASAHYGTQTFDQHLYRLVEDGEITPQVAVRYASNADDMRLRLDGVTAGSKT